MPFIKAGQGLRNGDQPALREQLYYYDEPRIRYVVKREFFFLPFAAVKCQMQSKL